MAYRTANIEALVPYILRLPEGAHFDVESDGTLEMQPSRFKVEEIRACFPGVWKKQYVASLGWWEYRLTLGDGTRLKIYADRKGPKSCKRIEEKVDETVLVPACDEHRETRTRTVVRWECPEEADDAVLPDKY